MTTGKQMAKKLEKSGFDMECVQEINHRDIVIGVPDEDGEYRNDNTEIATSKAFDILDVCGYQTGYGAWVLDSEYISNGDFMDKSSRHHY